MISNYRNHKNGKNKIVFVLLYKLYYLINNKLTFHNFLITKSQISFINLHTFNKYDNNKTFMQISYNYLRKNINKHIIQLLCL